MAEATHNQIFERIGAVERQQTDTVAALARIGERTDMAVEGVERNRDHFDQQLSGLWNSTNATNQQIVQLRSEMVGAAKVMKTLGYTLTFIVSILGLIIAL